MNYKKQAKEFLKLGLNPVPIKKEDKAPARNEHNTPISEDEIEDFAWEEIGFSTGAVSGSVEAIDFDLKNADSPDAIMKAFKKKVKSSLLSKLVVQTTPSNGYHFVYRCEDIDSSKKLAKNKDGKAIIETRGEGGLIKTYPSKGYKLIQGDFSKIPIITPEERLSLIVSAKMLNVAVIRDAAKRRTKEDRDYLQKFPEYNSDENIGIDLLEKHGWTLHSEDEVWYNFTRPNSKSKGLHAGYHKEGLFFFCFSTSQDTFETERPYNNHAIFAELECEGRYDIAYAKLYEMGYGDEKQRDKKKNDSELEEEDWEETLKNITFLSDEIEENGYLEQARKGEIAEGKTTGWPCLDAHMRIKDHSVNIGLGFDGVGKSVMMLSLMMASNVVHGDKWGMIMPENKTGMTRRRLIETKLGRPINSFKDEAGVFAKAMEEIRRDFKIISNKKHYTISDSLEMAKRLYEVYGINRFLIDPWNFFKVDGDSYAYNNRVLSEIRVFAEQYCSVYIMAHPRSDSPRSNKGQDGYLKAPSKYDIQGGADFPYRVDDYYIFHRVVNHPDEEMRRTMQVIVEKVKETETGGRPHSAGDYTPLVYETRNGFTGYWDEEGNNPMYKALVSKLGVRARSKSGYVNKPLPKISAVDAFFE